MRFEYAIDYDPERAERSQRRLEARGRFAYADRVPVGYCLVPRFFAPLFGLPYRALFTSAEEQYRWQLEFLRYRLEHIEEDIVCAGPAIVVGPYFDNVLDSAAFGAEVVWPENETPQTRPTIGTPDQMDAFEAPEPGSGLWGRARDWWLAMRSLAEQTRLTIGGREARVEVQVLGIGGLSPHMIAIDLVGADFYWWQVEYPAACHRFLAKITDGLIAAQRYFLEVDPRPRGGFGLAEDTATAMSAAAFREFCVPYASRLFDTFGAGLAAGRGVHMCGRGTHLHQALVHDLRATSLDLFGYEVTPAEAAANLGGRLWLWGNLNPMLMLHGTQAEVKAAALEALETLAPCGGFLLGDGANVCPGTPLENLAAVAEAAREYGRPPTLAEARRTPDA